MPHAASVRRALIRTYSPTTNANYGGILQAWALQQALEELGVEAWTDTTYADRPRLANFRKAARSVQIWLSRLMPTWALSRSQIGGRLLKHDLDRSIVRFSASNMRLVRLYRSGRNVDKKLLGRFDAFIAGSDQIWRPDYTDVPSFLLDFVPQAFEGPRVAYAASFGKPNSTLFNENFVTETRQSARRLTSSSVREASAVAIAREIWGIEPEWMPDPTLLIRASRYRLLAGSGRNAPSVPVTYILDRQPTDAAWRSRLVGSLGQIKDLLPPKPADLAEFRANRESFRKPSIEAWLGALDQASMVVTDSFHGCVFSILFNRPFVVLPNEERGTDRMRSLLELTGLEERLVPDREWAPTEADLSSLLSVDWARVNGVLANERERGLVFLANSLGLRGHPREPSPQVTDA